MSWEPVDPRSVANLMLEDGHAYGYEITNLALQKLLYFAHGLFLIETDKALVSGYFEAWQFGPVHPTIYQAFKKAGHRPINFRACKVNILTGIETEVRSASNPLVKRYVNRILSSYGPSASSHLVKLSHAKMAPWDYVVEKGKRSVALGLRIPNDVIKERFKFHKVPVSEQPSVGEAVEDTPFA